MQIGFLHSLIELMLMDALWCTVAPLHCQEIEQLLKRQAFAQVSLMSFIQPPLLYRMDLLFLLLALDICCVFLCALCSSQTFKMVKQKWHRFFRTLCFSNHEPARHKRHHESRLQTGWRGQQTASVARRCVSSIPIHHEAGMILSPWFVSAATVAWPWPKWIPKMEQRNA